MLACDGVAGIAFSPNSRFIYISTGYHLYQYDTEATDFANSGILVALYDGFVTSAPWPANFATTFFLLQLAPDGKIYMSTTNGTPYLHVIDYPDSLGMACNVRQHGLILAGLNAAGIPNFPNYRLGALAGSACDTLWSTAVQPIKEKVNIQVYPNPVEKELSISLQNVQGKTTFVLYDALGKVVLQQVILQGVEVAKIKVAYLPKGMYFYLLKEEQSILSQGKIIKE